MKKYAFIIMLIFLTSCVNKRSKAHHVRTVNLCTYKPNGCICNLYREDFNIYGMGALSSDVNSVYLTDSTNFRLYVGIYDEANEMIIIKCNGEIIHTTIIAKLEPNLDKTEIIESKTYNIRALKLKHSFD